MIGGVDVEVVGWGRPARGEVAARREKGTGGSGCSDMRLEVSMASESGVLCEGRWKREKQ